MVWPKRPRGVAQGAAPEGRSMPIADRKVRRAQFAKARMRANRCAQNDTLSNAPDDNCHGNSDQVLDGIGKKILAPTPLAGADFRARHSRTRR